MISEDFWNAPVTFTIAVWHTSVNVPDREVRESDLGEREARKRPWLIVRDPRREGVRRANEGVREGEGWDTHKKQG